jgi:hypothetical protein
MKMRKSWDVTIHNLSYDSPVVKRAIIKGWTRKRVFILS